MRAIIFDLDGTLLDTVDDLANAVNTVLVRHGLAVHPRERYHQFVGDGARVLVTRALPPDRRDEATITALHAEFSTEYRQSWDRMTRPYDGVLKMLIDLSNRGLPMAVLSNKPDEFTQRCVARFLPGIRFSAVRGARTGVALKPDPAGALAIAREWAIPPQEIVFLGDTSVDRRTAESAGMVFAGASWGFRPEEVQDAGIRFDHPHQVATLFGAVTDVSQRFLCLPLVLVGDGRPCLLVGAGAVATQKLRWLLEQEAQVVVMAPDIGADVEDLARQRPGLVEIRRSPYTAGDLSGFLMVVAATADATVNQQVAKDARTAGIPVNVVDAPALCSVYVPAVVRRGPLTIAVASDGTCPALSGALREELEDAYGPWFADFAAAMSRLRRRLADSGMPMEERKRQLRAVAQRAVRSSLDGLTGVALDLALEAALPGT